MRRMASALALVAVVTTGCATQTNPSAPPNSSEPPADGGIFPTIEELMRAYDEVGQCSAPKEKSRKTVVCEDGMMLGTASSESERDEAIRELRFVAKRIGHGILVGKNWIITGEDIEPARKRLGGIVDN